MRDETISEKRDIEAVKRKQPFLKRLEAQPSLFFLLGYLIVIVVGTVLLTSPLATADGSIADPVNAFFVSTSAVCVTGLSPVVTAEYWSMFGQTVILVLIQIGGLGIMTAMAIFGFLMRKRFSLTDRNVMMAEKNQSGLTGMVRLIRFILIATFVIEGIGMAVLATDFIPRFGVKRGLWYALFHAVSAFCNAGFDIFGPSSLVELQSNPLVLLTIATLVVVAGIGYTVYLDLLPKRNKKRWSLHTKIVLVTTALLLVGGALLLFVAEKGNSQTISSMGTGTKWLNAFFQSVTTRTAGFFSFAQEKMTSAGTMITIFLMFIGGSPAGTAGGFKTTTLVALLFGALSRLRTSKDTIVFNRRLSSAIVMDALLLFILAVIWISVVLILLCFTDGSHSVIDLMFETVSAYGTVGLSRNLTGSLSETGRMLIALTMLYGKLGPITMMQALLPKARHFNNRLAQEPIMVG